MAKSAKKAVKATTTKSGGKSAAKPKKSAAALEETLDEEEREFCAMRVDMPGVQGASAVGIVGIGVSKSPGRNEFFRTHPEFRPIVAIADLEAGMERQYFAVTKEMKEALQNIGITATEHVLYLTVTSRGSVKVIPIRCPDGEGDQNEYVRSKEIGLTEGISTWVRLFTDRENKCYKVYRAPNGRFADPVWPALKPAKIFKLAFRERGFLIDSVEHPAFRRWAARDAKS